MISLLFINANDTEQIRRVYEVERTKNIVSLSHTELSNNIKHTLSFSGGVIAT